MFVKGIYIVEVLVRIEDDWKVLLRREDEVCFVHRLLGSIKINDRREALGCNQHCDEGCHQEDCRDTNPPLEDLLSLKIDHTCKDCAERCIE